MAMRDKGASVAPKERINIIYKPNDSTGREATELPFRMMVMGQFSAEDDGSPIQEREPINVNQKNFNSVMEKLGAGASFQSENTISGSGDEVLDVDLKFKHIRDFNPDEVARKVPEVQKLLQMRDSLIALKGPVGNLPNLRKVIQSKLVELESRGDLAEVLKIENKSNDSEA